MKFSSDSTTNITSSCARFAQNSLRRAQVLPCHSYIRPVSPCRRFLVHFTFLCTILCCSYIPASAIHQDSNPSRLQFHLQRSHHMCLLCCMQLSSPTRLLGQDLLPKLHPEVISACHSACYIRSVVSIFSLLAHLLKPK